MERLAHKRANNLRRSQRVRTTVVGTTSRPRLSVHISNLHIAAQIVDDSVGKTLVAATTVGQKIEGNMSQKAAWVGSEIASKAVKAKIKKVVFDRGERKYHGRVEQLADAARKAGLEF